MARGYYCKPRKQRSTEGIKRGIEKRKHFYARTRGTPDQMRMTNEELQRSAKYLAPVNHFLNDSEQLSNFLKTRLKHFTYIRDNFSQILPDEVLSIAVRASEADLIIILETYTEMRALAKEVSRNIRNEYSYSIGKEFKYDKVMNLFRRALAGMKAMKGPRYGEFYACPTEYLSQKQQVLRQQKLRVGSNESLQLLRSNEFKQLSGSGSRAKSWKNSVSALEAICAYSPLLRINDIDGVVVAKGPGPTLRIGASSSFISGKNNSNIPDWNDDDIGTSQYKGKKAFIGGPIYTPQTVQQVNVTSTSQKRTPRFTRSEDGRVIPFKSTVNNTQQTSANLIINENMSVDNASTLNNMINAQVDNTPRVKINNVPNRQPQQPTYSDLMRRKAQRTQEVGAEAAEEEFQHNVRVLKENLATEMENEGISVSMDTTEDPTPLLSYSQAARKPLQNLPTFDEYIRQGRTVRQAAMLERRDNLQHYSPEQAENIYNSRISDNSNINRYAEAQVEQRIQQETSNTQRNSGAKEPIPEYPDWDDRWKAIPQSYYDERALFDRQISSSGSAYAVAQRKLRMKDLNYLNAYRFIPTGLTQRDKDMAWQYYLVHNPDEQSKYHPKNTEKSKEFSNYQGPKSNLMEKMRAIRERDNANYQRNVDNYDPVTADGRVNQ